MLLKLKLNFVIYFFFYFIISVQEQICERETPEIVQQSSLIQDTSHQYARFASPISDNSKQIIKFFLCFLIG